MKEPKTETSGAVRIGKKKGENVFGTRQRQEPEARQTKRERNADCYRRGAYVQAEFCASESRSESEPTTLGRNGTHSLHVSVRV